MKINLVGTVCVNQHAAFFLPNGAPVHGVTMVNTAMLQPSNLSPPVVRKEPVKVEKVDRYVFFYENNMPFRFIWSLW